MGFALCVAPASGMAARRGTCCLAGPADVAGLPLFLLVLFVLNLASLPLQNGISRAFERQADRTSLELTGNPAAFIRSEVPTGAVQPGRPDAAPGCGCGSSTHTRPWESGSAWPSLSPPRSRPSPESRGTPWWGCHSVRLLDLMSTRAPCGSIRRDAASPLISHLQVATMYEIC